MLPLLPRGDYNVLHDLGPRSLVVESTTLSTKLLLKKLLTALSHNLLVVLLHGAHLLSLTLALHVLIRDAISHDTALTSLIVDANSLTGRVIPAVAILLLLFLWLLTLLFLNHITSPLLNFLRLLLLTILLLLLLLLILVILILGASVRHLIALLLHAVGLLAGGLLRLLASLVRISIAAQLFVTLDQLIQALVCHSVVHLNRCGLLKTSCSLRYN